ncbi:uncharacterized protein LOC117139121 isoform X2 [Drosophila mauritiana]|uniref:Uncharacterized protein LOC117139121 isoform X2 n=1 Tax=Drosophila mauritiana TaxID=7226 RepID=A0A6P8JXH8_DROMA|nr:uncharacterized protein LOC117139121 isoform X2 [Drosophila mauritiana]
MSGIDDEASAIANATAGTKRSNDGGAGEQVSRLKGRKIAKLDRTTCSAGPSTTHPATTIFALNTYCWDMILSYLSLSTISLKKASPEVSANRSCNNYWT